MASSHIPLTSRSETQGSSPAEEPLRQRDWERARAEPATRVEGSLGPTPDRVFLCRLLMDEVLNEVCTLPRRVAGKGPVRGPMGFGGSSLCPAPLEDPSLLSPLSYMVRVKLCSQCEIAAREEDKTVEEAWPGRPN